MEQNNVSNSSNLPVALFDKLPAQIKRSDKPVQTAWSDFFDGKLANPHTRRAYETAVRQFLIWCDERRLELPAVMAGDVGRYLRQHTGSLPTKKLHLSAIRRFFNILVERHICILNPALVAETERYQVVEGKTPEITAKQIKILFESIPIDSQIGLRDRAAISIMIYTGARAGAVSKLELSHYVGSPGKRKLRFLEKGGKSREIAVRSDLEECIDVYLDAIEGSSGKQGPMFLAAKRREPTLTSSRLKENDMYKMVKRRMKKAGLPAELSAHSFRTATITDLIGQGIPIEDVQRLVGHKDARTTKLYDKTNRKVTRNLVERISL